jgi:serine/threonine-protein kinase
MNMTDANAGHERAGPLPQFLGAPLPAGGEGVTLQPAVAAEAKTLAPAPALPTPPAWDKIRIPGYEILGELGRGGMGVVYQARQVRLNRLVALKMILSGGHAGASELARFRTEAEAIARLEHPNIVQIYEMGEADGYPFVSLELCAGGSLADRLDGSPRPVVEAAQLVESLARAMEIAHEQRVIHRDLKPANILLTADGTPKITDFGLAKKLGEAGNTQSGTCLGTPSYMAPEQVESKASVGPAADVHALGAILYELLTGRPPFQAATPLDTLLQVVASEPIPPRQHQARIPRALESICLKCLEKDPARRFASAQELADDLRRFLNGEPVFARPPSVAGRLAQWAQQRPALAATVVAFTLFYVNHLFNLAQGTEGMGGPFHWKVTGLMLSWLLLAIGFQWLVGRPRFRRLGVYGWSAVEVIMLTELLLVANGPSSGLVIGYFLLIGAAGLRFRMALVWLVTGLAMASYLAVQTEASWLRSEQALAVPPHTAVIFVLGLAMMGLIQYLLLRRFRLALAQQER